MTTFHSLIRNPPTPEQFVEAYTLTPVFKRKIYHQLLRTQPADYSVKLLDIILATNEPRISGILETLISYLRFSKNTSFYSEETLTVVWEKRQEELETSSQAQKFDSFFIYQPNTPHPIIKTISEKRIDDRILVHPTTPTEELIAYINSAPLSTTQKTQRMAHVLRNATITPELLQHIPPKYYFYQASNPQYTTEDLKKMVTKKEVCLTNPDHLREIVRNPNCPPHIVKTALTTLAGNSNWMTLLPLRVYDAEMLKMVLSAAPTSIQFIIVANILALTSFPAGFTLRDLPETEIISPESVLSHLYQQHPEYVNYPEEWVEELCGLTTH